MDLSTLDAMVEARREHAFGTRDRWYLPVHCRCGWVAPDLDTSHLDHLTEHLIAAQGGMKATFKVDADV
jgi:hypothetical protein